MNMRESNEARNRKLQCFSLIFLQQPNKRVITNLITTHGQFLLPRNKFHTKLEALISVFLGFKHFFIMPQGVCNSLWNIRTRRQLFSSKYKWVSSVCMIVSSSSLWYISMSLLVIREADKKCVSLFTKERWQWQRHAYTTTLFIFVHRPLILKISNDRIGGNVFNLTPFSNGVSARYTEITQRFQTPPSFPEPVIKPNRYIHTIIDEHGTFLLSTPSVEDPSNNLHNAQMPC